MWKGLTSKGIIWDIVDGQAEGNHARFKELFFRTVIFKFISRLTAV